MAGPLTPGRRATLTFGLPFALFFVGYGALALVNVFGLAAYTETATLTPAGPGADGEVARGHGHAACPAPTARCT